MSVSQFKGKTIVVGVSGGIAAYKAVDLCRRLFDAGAIVVPVLSPDVLKFVGELTFSALCSVPAKSQLFGDPNDPSPHTRIGKSADLVIVAPATARLIGRYAHAISEDLLTATLLATRAPVLVAPAMHTEMWEHLGVQDNMAILARRGVHIVGPGIGALASGDFGAGRMAEPSEIFDMAASILSKLNGDDSSLAQMPNGADCQGTQEMAGVKCLVSAGGTREAIDPVRYISNRSSGKQGYALAGELQSRGASVTVVATVGLSQSSCFRGEVVMVQSAQEMHDAIVSQSDNFDVIVMAAAVADFRPVQVANEKIKKGERIPQIVLEPTTDILAALGAKKPVGQTLVGFAAETNDLVANAKAKLVRKNLDLIVANDVSVANVGFEHDTNAVTILSKQGSTSIELTSKQEIARAVVDAILAVRSQ